MTLELVAAWVLGLVAIVSVNAVCWRAVKKPPNVTYKTMAPLESANRLMVDLVSIKTNLHHLNPHNSAPNIASYRDSLTASLDKVLVRVQQSIDGLNK